jgi:hypothetical protein
VAGPLPPLLERALAILSSGELSYAAFADQLYRVDLGAPTSSLSARSAFLAEEILLALTSRGLLSPPVLPELRPGIAQVKLQPIWEAFTQQVG